MIFETLACFLKSEFTFILFKTFMQIRPSDFVLKKSMTKEKSSFCHFVFNRRRRWHYWSLISYFWSFSGSRLLVPNFLQLIRLMMMFHMIIISRTTTATSQLRNWRILSIRMVINGELFFFVFFGLLYIFPLFLGNWKLFLQQQLANLEIWHQWLLLKIRLRLLRLLRLVGFFPLALVVLLVCMSWLWWSDSLSTAAASRSQRKPCFPSQNPLLLLPRMVLQMNSR